jgi:hypothetical protein
VPKRASNHRPPSIPKPTVTTKVHPIFMYGPRARIICGQEGLEGGGLLFPDMLFLTCGDATFRVAGTSMCGIIEVIPEED